MMDTKVKDAIYRQVAREPFAQKFGLELADLDEGYSRVEMTFTPDMENIFGLAHGGALFALIDEAFETASNSHGTTAVALNMNINYVSTPAAGSRLTAEAKEVNRTRKTANYDIKVFDHEKRLIAFCQALVYRMEKPLPFLNTFTTEGPENSPQDGSNQNISSSLPSPLEGEGRGGGEI